MHYQSKAKLEWKGELGPVCEGLDCKAQSILSEHMGSLKVCGQ